MADTETDGGVMSTYRLYRDHAACDDGDCPPFGEYSTLTEAMTAAGLPDVRDWWRTPGIPEEIFTPCRCIRVGSGAPEHTGPDWSIFSPDAAAEAEAEGRRR